MSHDVLRQACAIPFLRSEQLDFCLITSQKGRWIFPKGIIEPGESLEEAALKESWEEAGIKGEIVSSSVGSYEDFKWNRPLLITAVIMKVTAVEDDWPERDMRERCWVDADEVRQRLSNAHLLRCFETACTELNAE